MADSANALASASPAALDRPLTEAERRNLRLVEFACEVFTWQALGRCLETVLCGDGETQGLLALRDRIFAKREGRLVVNRPFIPDLPPWPEKWPEPTTPEEAVRLRALRLYLERLREVHALLWCKPAVDIPYGDGRRVDLGGYTIPEDYEQRIEIAAARLGVINDSMDRASVGFLPEIPTATRALLPLAFTQPALPAQIVDGLGVTRRLVDASGTVLAEGTTGTCVDGSLEE